MRLRLLASAVLVAVTASAEGPTVRLMTLEPGHFHAALIQREMYAGVDPTVHVFAPLGPDLLAHLGRVAAFNRRAEQPTSWQLEVHAGPEPLARLLREKPGNAVVLSGRNRGKIDMILASVEAGLHVLADKPWLIEARDFPKLERTLALAESRGLVAYDVMTERYEITTVLQRELAQDAAVAGSLGAGSGGEPTLELRSVHHLLKTVAGAVNLRPAWFFDTAEQGEALADVATHLVDLASFLLFPEQVLDHRRDLQLLAARRWPTTLTADQLLRLTGDKALPPALAERLTAGQLDYLANGEARYTLRGRHVRIEVLWNFEAPEGGGDTHQAVLRGSRSRLEIRQGSRERWRPELYVVPLRAEEAAAVRAALERRLEALAATYPGLAIDAGGGELRVVIPDRYRVGHEAHFAEVTRRFLGYLRNPASLPAWERAGMLAKYAVTTQAVELSRAR
jgi:predicted dehydrogenase